MSNNDILQAIATLTTKVDNVETNVKKDIGDLKKHMTNLFRATLSGTPVSILHAMEIPIVKEDNSQNLTGAVLGKDGFGSATWTYVKRMEKIKAEDQDETEFFYAMSCAHCSLNYKMEGPLQFVVIPPDLNC